MPKSEKPYTPSKGRSGMKSDKAPLPKKNLPAPKAPKVKRII